MEKISQPKEFFDKNPEDLEQVVNVVNSGFGRSLDFQDIYNHITSPQEVYVLRNGSIKAIAAFNRTDFADCQTLVVEGICLHPSIQGKGIFNQIVDNVHKTEPVICLRTQNPRMYRALEKYCSNMFPCEGEGSTNLKAVLLDFAGYLGCSITNNGVVSGHYRGLFYGQEQHHSKVDPLFKKLGINPFKGDALLVAGNPKNVAYEFPIGFVRLSN